MLNHLIAPECSTAVIASQNSDHDAGNSIYLAAIAVLRNYPCERTQYPGTSEGKTMNVEDIMTTNVRTISSDKKLAEVVSLMCIYRYSGIPVVDDGKLVGTVSESDVLGKMFPKLEDLMDHMSNVNYDTQMNQYNDVVNITVKDVMTPVVITVKPDMHILQAASVMVGRKFRRIPVAVGDKLLGMVSMGDVHKAIYQSTLATKF